MIQPRLFLVRPGDPPTSHEAARTTRTRAPRHAQIVLDTLRAHPGGMTDWEIAEACGLYKPSVSKRRLDLQRQGLVAPTEELRRSPTGSRAMVWVAL